MGKAVEPQSVKLVIGMLAKDEKLFDKIEEFFVKEFEYIDYRSPILTFDYTTHYEVEFGPNLKRKFISFKTHIHPEDIPKIKIITNDIEQKFAKQKNNSLKRQINIDPGYISDSKFILVTTKDYFHRIYLKDGIYAEVTLMWKRQDQSFTPFPWTYSDYQTKDQIKILNILREMYMKERGNHAE